ncbi:MAG: hypothetical protein JWL77_1831, partial [Chthonomonadaceae bacterium]|nr:hypothetical protein [Chthonomonadaceae bacterium]
MNRRFKPPRELPTLVLLVVAGLILAAKVPAFRTSYNLTTLGKDAA